MANKRSNKKAIGGVRLSPEAYDQVHELMAEHNQSKAAVTAAMVTSGLAQYHKRRVYDGLSQKHGAFLATYLEVPVFYGPPEAVDNAIAEFESIVLEQMAEARLAVKETLAKLPVVTFEQAEQMADTIKAPAVRIRQ